MYVLTRETTRGLTCLTLGLVAGILSTDWAIGALVACLVWIAIGGLNYLAFERWTRRPLGTTASESSVWLEIVGRLRQNQRRSRERSAWLIAELRWLKDTFDAIPDGWIVIHRAGSIETINASARALLGLEADDKNQNLLALIRNPAIVELVRGDIDSDIVEIPAPTDEAKRLELRHIRVGEDRSIVLIRDVTTLNRLLTMRQDFVANVSHELRTPLTVIIGYLEALSEDDIEIDVIRESIARLESPAARMKALVEDLLTLSRLESSPMPEEEDFEIVDVPSMLTAIATEARSISSDGHDISLELDCGCTVLGIASELHSAFSNLVSNAVRYSPDGGAIVIRWASENGKPVFSVRDEGVGIPPEHISRLTERFYRVDMKKSRGRGGTGLGLAIVKHILRRHHSELEVTSRVGEGSTFSFALRDASDASSIAL